MLEGKEFEKPIGKSGSVSVDVDSHGYLKIAADWAEGPSKVSFHAEADILAVLEDLAKKTDNKVDDNMVAMVRMALGR